MYRLNIIVNTLASDRCVFIIGLKTYLTMKPIKIEAKKPRTIEAKELSVFVCT